MPALALPNMKACIEESRLALEDMDRGPSDPSDYHGLLDRLAGARRRLPRLYRRVVFRPFATELEEMGAEEFDAILAGDPDRDGDAGILLDIAHAILQNGEGYNALATDAFQEVVADLYDGFLCAEDRAGVKPPDRGVVAPLVKWGSPESGAYTWPVDATSEFGSMAAIVNLPPSHARGALMGWAALGHETAGHDILHADDGLLLEFKGLVHAALAREKLPAVFPRYWTARIDETASDVLGILNMGPAAGMGVVAYFRAFEPDSRLRSSGPGDDEHPADVLRGFLAAETVALLSFAKRGVWSDALTRETHRDVRTIRLAGQVVSEESARRSAAVVAATLAKAPLQSLEGRSLIQIQDWRNHDENIVAELRRVLSAAAAVRYRRGEGHYAAHAVAAGVYEALLTRDADVRRVFRRMLDILKTMHNENPGWGPLFLDRTRHGRRLARRGHAPEARSRPRS